MAIIALRKPYGAPPKTDEGKPRWFSLIGRSLRDGPAPIPVYGWDFSRQPLDASLGDKGDKVAAGVNPAANAALVNIYAVRFSFSQLQQEHAVWHHSRSASMASGASAATSTARPGT